MRIWVSASQRVVQMKSEQVDYNLDQVDCEPLSRHIDEVKPESENVCVCEDPGITQTHFLGYLCHSLALFL